MKHHVFFAVLITFLLGTASAEAQVKWGVKGGYNITDMSLDKTVLNSENRHGFFVGPTLRVETPLLGLGFDISALYDQRESKVGNDTPVTMTTKMVTVPLNVRFSIGTRSTFALFGYAGPQIGFNLNDDDKVIDQVKSWRYRESNFSVNLGGGLLLGNCFQVTANYNIVCGRTADVTVGSAIDMVKDDLKKHEAKENAWQIGAAFFF